MMEQYVAAECMCNEDRQRQKVAHVLLVHTSSSHYDTGCSTLSDVHESGLAWYCVEVPDKHTEHAYLR